MSKPPPDVTVLIPIHRTKGNREWLQQAVNSLGKGVPYLVLENDGEVAEAFNVGLKTATTEYVLPFGADDIAAPDMVHELRSAIWDVDVAYPSMTLVSEDLSRPTNMHAAPEFCGHRLLQSNYVSGASMIRRAKALEVGGYRELESWEDWDLWVRMWRAGARFKAVPMAHMYYRQVDGSRNTKITDWIALRDQIVGTQDPTERMVATFYMSPTPAVAYLRCVLPARHLPGVAREDLDVALKNDKGDHIFLGHVGTAVFQLGASKTTAVYAQQMRADGIKVLIETDDNYLAASTRGFRERSGWGLNIGDSPHTVEGHKKIVQSVDGVIVTTDYLASQYRKVNPNVYVCGNQVDPQDWQPLSKPDDGIFRIGWFASASHKGDEKLIRRAMEWASKQPDVEVVMFGYDPGWRFKYRALPWATDMSAYRKAMQYVDVGVAPVIPTPFTRGRSDVKWLEYSMSGAAAIVQDTDCYRTVPDGLALKARDAKGFYEAVRYLVRNRDRARELAADAREYVLEERTIQANIDKWREAVAA